MYYKSTQFYCTSLPMSMSSPFILLHCLFKIQSDVFKKFLRFVLCFQQIARKPKANAEGQWRVKSVLLSDWSIPYDVLVMDVVPFGTELKWI